MTATRLFVFALVCGVALYATLTNHRLNVELAAARTELASASALGSKAMEVLVLSDRHNHDEPPGQAASPQEEANILGGCRCEPCADTDASVDAPSGRRFRSAHELQAWASERLDSRIAAVFPEQGPDGMQAEQRQAVVRLLMEFRELRQAEIAQGDSASTDTALRDELFHKQGQFNEMTGMGIAEFLNAIDVSEPAVASDVMVASEPAAGDERKRFADETARLLGISEPGSHEVLDDQGRWQQR